MKYGDEKEFQQHVVSLLREGEQDLVCTEILRRHGPSLRGHLRGLIRNREAADDRYQDLCIALVSYLARFHEEVSLRCWLFRKAHDVYVDWCRHPSRRWIIGLDSELKATLQAPSQTSGASGDERDRLLTAACESLDDEDRELLVLRTERRFSFREIGTMLRIKESTARQRFQRIKAQLRIELMAE